MKKFFFLLSLLCILPACDNCDEDKEVRLVIHYF